MRLNENRTFRWYGHLIVAESVRSNCGLDRIVLIPSGCPPHKENRSYSEPELRLEMLKQAVQSCPQFEISTFELNKNETAYAIDTIQAFLNDPSYADHTLFYIIGADSLLDLQSWRDPEKILSSMDTLVAAPPGYNPEQAEDRFLKRVTLVDAPFISISSTEIRKRIREGKSVRFWVPDPVYYYIEEKGLYR